MAAVLALVLLGAAVSGLRTHLTGFGRRTALPGELTALPAAGGPGIHQGSPPGTVRVTVVLAAGLWWDDLNRLRSGPMGPILAAADVALLNTATAGWMLPEHGYATAAAGTRALSAPEGGQAFQLGESHGGRPVPEVYRARTGKALDTDAEATGPGMEPDLSRPQAVLHLGLGALQGENRVLDHRVALGLLGDRLAAAGLRTAVFGNADLPGDPARHGAMLAMDSAGRVPTGLVGAAILTPAAWMPGGLATDWDALRQAWLQERADFSVVESGDLWRLERARRLMTADAYGAARTQAVGALVQGLSRFLSSLEAPAGSAAGRESQHLLLLVSPAPAGDGPRPQGLGWVLTWRWGEGWDGPAGGGLLASATTRRSGLVALVDLAPTVLASFGLEHGDGRWTGRPLQRAGSGAGEEDRWALLGDFRTRVEDNHVRRVPLIQTYVVVQIIVVLASLAAVFIPRLRLRLAPTLEPVLRGVAAVPLAYLLLPLFPGTGAAAAALWVLLMVAVFVTLVPGGGDRSWLPFTVVGLVTTTVVVVDLLTGANLMVRSPFGYTLVGGARYYGIGNEYMGVLLGGTAVGAGGLLQFLKPPLVRGRPLLLAALGLLSLLTGLTGLGANFGGALAAVAALAAAGAVLGGRRRGRALPGLMEPGAITRIAPTAVAAGAAVALALAAADMMRGEAASHVGVAARRLTQGDWAGIWEIARRKWAINARLLRWTVWTRVLLASLGGVLLLVFRPVGLYRRLAAGYPYLGAAFAAATTGSLAALVLNDSGVVAAATTMLIPSAALFYMAFFDTLGLSGGETVLSAGSESVPDPRQAGEGRSMGETGCGGVG